jgi:tetratricopeptide (TPR) repeat protein
LLIASLIEPENVELLKLSQRASNLEQFLSLLAQAEEAESAGRLLLAQSTLQRAVSLDSASHKARSELERVTLAYIKQRFNEAMSEGYISLNKDQFALARIAFRKAAGLVAGSAVAISALNDVNAAETANRLANLQRNGLSFESQEQWAAAVAAYTEALQIDDNLLFARQGLKRSKSRAMLDQQFLSVIEQPGRLSEQAVADATAVLLRQATAITPRGPILQQQLEQLETILEIANTPIQVILHSDMETEVTVRKVARLGRFKQRQLELRPGTYIAIGTREGYRDVRRTFSINHDGEPPTVIIACTEQI